jgi:hypothetical protein
VGETEKSPMLVYVNSAILAYRERKTSSCGIIHSLDEHCYPGVRHFVFQCHYSLETVMCPGVELVFRSVKVLTCGRWGKGGLLLLLVGLKEGVKDCIGEDILVVV